MAHSVLMRMCLTGGCSKGKVRWGHVGLEDMVSQHGLCGPPLSDTGSCFSYLRVFRNKQHLQEMMLRIEWELGMEERADESPSYRHWRMHM